MDTYNLSLSRQDMQVVVNALVARPYGEVFQLIANIQGQAAAQEAAWSRAAEAATKPADTIKGKVRSLNAEPPAA